MSVLIWSELVVIAGSKLVGTCVIQSTSGRSVSATVSFGGSFPSFLTNPLARLIESEKRSFELVAFNKIIRVVKSGCFKPVVKFVEGYQS
jgi:hypothetical protein